MQYRIRYLTGTDKLRVDNLMEFAGDSEATQYVTDVAKETNDDPAVVSVDIADSVYLAMKINGEVRAGFIKGVQ